jgi:hypothetical protein
MNLEIGIPNHLNSRDGLTYERMMQVRGAKDPPPGTSRPSQDRDVTTDDLPGKGGTPDWTRVPSRDDEPDVRKSDLPGNGGTGDW